MLLANLEVSADEVAYREEVFHPALPEPQVTTGTMWMGPDGELVRMQLWPERETVNVGERFLTVTTPGGEPNILPIPDDMAPFFMALRGILSGRPGTVSASYPMALQDSGPPWRISLNAGASDQMQTVLTGCGGQLHTIELILPDLARRVLSFEPGA
ncbi:MAG: hypothetical protein AAF409_13065 [Pseudomonadota bacterium]